MQRRHFLMTPAALATAAEAKAQLRGSREPAVDFRYAPLSGQTAICFADDPYKSLVGERGDLRYGHPRSGGLDNFAAIVEFDVNGMHRPVAVAQRLESPSVPVVRSRLEHPALYLDLTVFATRQEGEGRVDNVLLDIVPRRAGQVHAVPRLILRTRQEASAQGHEVLLDGKPFLTASQPVRLLSIAGGFAIPLTDGSRFFLRFPMEGQRVEAGAPEPLLEAARAHWRTFRAFQSPVEWSIPGVYGEFAQACARNILQAREVRNGRLTFQVGPTVYRGLWVVDGHFILEAARYMGFDAEAQQGLETTWAMQNEAGAIFAGAGQTHWKDTGIAMFSLVRQAELAQDWSYFRRMAPEVLRGVRFIDSLREVARREGSQNGKYGLLARGMGDGGLGGSRDEFTNTLWSLAGLRAVSEAAQRLGDARFEPAAKLYRELREAFFKAARQEMRRHPQGFEYLPMLLKIDKQWEDPDEWNRPRPQVAQWALSHAIYPGRLFEPGDPIVAGHVALMKACTQEDIPAETGWLPHQGVWNYNAAFVAHACLWARQTEWARRTFDGFLNHATPLYCWREERPLRGSAFASYIGDMPHNWASAECLLYLRHALALEDGEHLRLLEGIRHPGEPMRIAGSPTRFGRISMSLEPAGGGRRWALRFERASGPAPRRITVPEVLGGKRFSGAEGTQAKSEGHVVTLEAESRSFTVRWS